MNVIIRNQPFLKPKILPNSVLIHRTAWHKWTAIDIGGRESRKPPLVTFKAKRQTLKSLETGAAELEAFLDGQQNLQFRPKPTADTQYILKVHKNILSTCRPHQRKRYLDVFWTCVYFEFYDRAAQRLESYFHRRLGATWAKR